MKNYYFLSGLPRSGSTILGSILNQNKSVYVSPTSPLMDIFYLSENLLTQLEKNYTYDKEAKLNSLHNNLADLYYADVPQKNIIDKHRVWPKNVEQIKKFITKDPKIICTYRPVTEVICSYLKMIDNDPNNIVDKELTEKGLQLNTYNRSMWIWFNYVEDTYNSFKFGLDNNRDCILVIEYDELVNNTQGTLNKVYDFIGIERYQHTFTDIKNTCGETKDLEWGFKGLHDIRDSISKTSYDPKQVLGRHLYEHFSLFDRELLIIN